MSDTILLDELASPEILGALKTPAEKAPLAGATCYESTELEEGLRWVFEPGALAGANYLTADFVFSSKNVVYLALTLREGEEGPQFFFSFSGLPYCQIRVPLPFAALDQNTWYLGRQGACLKPQVGGDRTDLSRVDRMTLTVLRTDGGPARWCMTPWTATTDEPPALTQPVLPMGPLVDELGQSVHRDWPAKTRSVEEVTTRLRKQLDDAPSRQWPEGFSKWGGSKARQLDATGFFRTHHDGARWWMVDPDGHPFWSAGLDCIGPGCETPIQGLENAFSWLPDPEGEYADAFHGRAGKAHGVSFLTANMIRTFGADGWRDAWEKIALSQMKEFGFNTVANWSDWRIARAAGFPYVRPLDMTLRDTPALFRDFPDVFDPRFEAEAEVFAQQLVETAGDPAFVGFFLMNEPKWGFASQTPAEGMLFNSEPGCRGRKALGGFLRERYADDAALAGAWGDGATFEAVADRPWTASLGDAAKADLEAFSTEMVKRLFGGLSEACRRVDPNHLNLGARYYRVPPDWALEGMDGFDVFSVNCYQARVDRDLAGVSERMGAPVVIGEWHFGALDVGLPASGIGHVPDQEGRGKAFRLYTEDAAAQPWCVGVHYFILYDQSAMGRYDGETYNIGLVDTCGLPYEAMARAARAAHERVYQVATGDAEPYDDAPKYLPVLFG